MADDRVKECEARLLALRQSFAEMADKVYIANAGEMNHGKSSLLNALLDVEDAFKVADKRETVKVAEREWPAAPQVFFCDTPGLQSGNLRDDAESFAAFEKANAVLFVHTVKVGELHSQEVEHIRQIAALMPEGYFLEHFVLVLTFSDEYNDEAKITAIRDKIAAETRAACDGREFRIFLVSNERYWRGAHETDERKRKVFTEKSGIPELRGYLAQQVPLWRGEALQLRQQSFELHKAKAVEALREIRQEHRRKNDEAEKRMKAIGDRAKRAFGKLRDTLREYAAQHTRATDERYQALSRRNDLQAQHEREYY